MTNLSNIVTPTNLLTSSNPTISTGNLNFTSTAQRITGDFSNATIANRLMFQTSTANTSTTLVTIPSGTGVNSGYIAYNNSDPTNSSRAQFAVIGNTEVHIMSAISGNGTYLPMTFSTGGSERMRIDTTGRVGIGTTPSVAGVQLTVLGGGTQLSPGTTSQEGVRIQRATGYATFSGINNDNNAYNGLQFFTGASAAVTIDTSGNVGIGATSSGAKLQVNAGTAQYSSSIAVRTAPNQYEWGHVNTAGYGSVIGAEAGSGAPFIAFSAGAGANNNTYKTYGLLGTVIRTDNAGGLGIYRVSSANADNQSLSGPTAFFDASGNVAIGGASSSVYTVDINTASATFRIRDASGGNDFGVKTIAGPVSLAGSRANTSIGFMTNDTERMRIDNAGNVGLGASGSAATKFYIGGTLPTSGTVSYTTLASVTIPSGSTGGFYGFYSYPATQAATFTCAGVTHFIAGWQSTGANSSITNQYGFLADSTLTSATNNFGFYGNIAAGANRWNFYAGGTANNFFAGNVGIGIATPAANLDITGSQASNIVTVAALDIDCTQGNYFIKTINGASTFTFSNPPATRAYGFTLELTHTSGTVTWPTTVRWPGNTAPTLSTANTHLFTFITDDGGSRWRGSSLVNYYQ